MMDTTKAKRELPLKTQNWITTLQNYRFMRWRDDSDWDKAFSQLSDAILAALTEAQNDGHASGSVGYMTLCGKYNVLRERCERLRLKVIDAYADIYASVEFEDAEGLQLGDLADNLRESER
jgi:hypothetical protein